MDRTILHCDLNSFYASVELLSLPELRESGKPVAVCGDPDSRHGIILAKNEPAKAMGVKTAETIWQARQKCPGLVLLPAHRDQYRKYSRMVNAIYDRFTDLVEPFSIDESWLDITGSMHLWGGDGKAIADRIRETVKAETGLTVSVGVSFNKVFAKMGSDYKKPDATTVITRENFRQLLWPLPVTDLLFVGGAAAKVLRGYGVQTEHEPVIPARDLPPPKSVGSGLTFRRNLLGLEDVRAGLSALSDEVAARLRRHGLKCTTVQITIRDPSFRDICRQKRLPAPTYVSRDISGAALELLLDAWNLKLPIRALTVTGQNLVDEADAGEQLDLFAAGAAPHRDKLERLERTMDKIRDKYGGGAITFASAVRGEPGGTQRQDDVPPVD